MSSRYGRPSPHLTPVSIIPGLARKSFLHLVLPGLMRKIPLFWSITLLCPEPDSLSLPMDTCPLNHLIRHLAQVETSGQCSHRFPSPGQPGVIGQYPPLLGRPSQWERTGPRNRPRRWQPLAEQTGRRSHPCQWLPLAGRTGPRQQRVLNTDLPRQWTLRDHESPT